jgi:phage/plasmid-associated DNA primase
MMQSNEIPRLSNRARGLSSKMLMLPFDKTYEGHEQFDLLDVLKAEIEGISRWCVQGAINLTHDEEWPVPTRSAEDIQDFHLANNPFDYFLTARFKKNPTGRVSNDVIRAQWYEWVKANKIKTHISDNMIPVKIRQESSWDIGRQKSGGTRYLSGLSLKKSRSTEV